MKGLAESPLGFVFEYLDRSESDYLYNEIFIENCYFQHDISLNDLNEANKDSLLVVLDIGANIGLFSLCCIMNFLTNHTVGSTMTLFSFEPIDEIFDTLTRNIQHNTSDVHEIVKTFLINSAINNTSNSDNDTELFYYVDKFPGESTRNIKERSDQRSILKNAIINSNVIDEYMKSEFIESEEMANIQPKKCKTMRLSNFINNNNITHINLLKVI